MVDVPQPQLTPDVAFVAGAAEPHPQPEEPLAKEPLAEEPLAKYPFVVAAFEHALNV